MTIDDIRVLVKTDESRILELKESAGELKECRACDEDFFRM